MAYQGLGYEIANVMPQAAATGLFASLCSAYQPAQSGGGIALTGSGAPTGQYSTVPGLQDIACQLAPRSDIRITADERKSEKEVLGLRLFHCLLSGYYPLFPPETDAGWKVNIDGNIYDLLGAESDSQSQMTRLNVRIAAI